MTPTVHYDYVTGRPLSSGGDNDNNNYVPPPPPKYYDTLGNEYSTPEARDAANQAIEIKAERDTLATNLRI